MDQSSKGKKFNKFRKIGTKNKCKRTKNVLFFAYFIEVHCVTLFKCIFSKRSFLLTFKLCFYLWLMTKHHNWYNSKFSRNLLRHDQKVRNFILVTNYKYDQKPKSLPRLICCHSQVRGILNSLSTCLESQICVALHVIHHLVQLSYSSPNAITLTWAMRQREVIILI